jgi:hypothetical protein
MGFFRRPRNRLLKRYTTEPKLQAMLKRSTPKPTNWRGRKAICDCKERLMKSGASRKTGKLHRNIFDRSQGRSIAGVIVMMITSESVNGNEIEGTNANPPRIEAIRRRETDQASPVKALQVANAKQPDG